MGIIVQKFGGSSVADAECIKRVAKRVGETYDQGNQVVVVVSAMGDTTDDLLKLADQVVDKPSTRELDMLISTGEQQSMALLSMALHHMGYPAISLTGQQAGILTDEVYSKSKILAINPARVKSELDANNIVIVAGFQGATSDNEITTLGRGGSDTTGVALAAVLKADVCEIFTDVDGVYTADPRLVKEAKKIDVISYDEMLEMASLGAAVLQPRSVEVAKQYDVKIKVRSSFNHNDGTIVQGGKDMNNDIQEMEKEVLVSGVAHDMNAVKVTVFGLPNHPGVASGLFNALADRHVNVDMIVQSQLQDQDVNNISFTVGGNDLEKTVEVLENIKKELDFKDYGTNSQVAKISIVGAGMISNPGVAAKMFRILAQNDVNIQMISTSEIKVSCIIDQEDTLKAANALHEAFNLA